MNKSLARRQEARDPFHALQRGIDRLFAEFRTGPVFDALPLFGAEARLPRIDVAETKDEVQVTADLPGMDEKDVEVTVSNHSLTIRGEKSTEKEDEKKNYHVKERTFGSIQRVVTLPDGANADKAKATFKKGVLTVTMPKTAEAKAGTRKIAIQAG